MVSREKRTTRPVDVSRRRTEALRVAPSRARGVTVSGAAAVPEKRGQETASGGPPPGSVDPRLIIWLSPSFPVGAFAYSHGLELAADRGWVRNRDDLASWMADLVVNGSVRNDSVLLAAAWRAVAVTEYNALQDANDLALALQPSAERRLETVTQGNAFLSTLAAAWPADKLASVVTALSGDIAYPVAVGAGAAAHGIALGGVLRAYAIAFVTNLVSAAIRLSIVGQTDGQRVIASLMPSIGRVADDAFSSVLGDVGGATLRSDLASLAHETQYSRLFRS